MKMSRNLPFLVIVAVAIGVLAYRGMSSRHAPTPAAFEAKTTLTAALENAQSTGRPVLAFATADWCGPCQSFKRGALADESIAAFITENTEPAYVDVTNSNDPLSSQAAQMLHVRSVPTLVLIDGEQEIARLEGGVGKSRLIGWLKEGIAQASD